MDYENRPILITGAARSGTSMIAASIHLCGAFKGNTGGGNRYNEKGMFENLALREQIIKPLLAAINVDRLGQYPLPATKDTVIPANLGQQIKRIMMAEGWDGKSQWMWKCAKMSLIWPAWLFAFPNSKWVIVRRKDEDIVRSCLKTGFMNKLSREHILQKLGLNTPEEGWQWWVDRHKEKFTEIISAGVNVQTVWPEKMIYGDYSEIKDTVEWLGLKWNGPAVMDFIEPRLWKARK